MLGAPRSRLERARRCRRASLRRASQLAAHPSSSPQPRGRSAIAFRHRSQSNRHLHSRNARTNRSPRPRPFEAVAFGVADWRTPRRRVLLARGGCRCRVENVDNQAAGGAASRSAIRRHRSAVLRHANQVAQHALEQIVSPCARQPGRLRRHTAQAQALLVVVRRESLDQAFHHRPSSTALASVTAPASSANVEQRLHESIACRSAHAQRQRLLLAVSCSARSGRGRDRVMQRLAQVVARGGRKSLRAVRGLGGVARVAHRFHAATSSRFSARRGLRGRC